MTIRIGSRTRVDQPNWKLHELHQNATKKHDHVVIKLKFFNVQQLLKCILGVF